MVIFEWQNLPRNFSILAQFLPIKTKFFAETIRIQKTVIPIRV